MKMKTTILILTLAATTFAIAGSKAPHAERGDRSERMATKLIAVH